MAIDNHPLKLQIDLIEGSSIDPTIINMIRGHAEGFDRVLLSLDSNHTHDHVLQELEVEFVSRDSYCIVFDTVIDDLPAGSFPIAPGMLATIQKQPYVIGFVDTPLNLPLTRILTSF